MRKKNFHPARVKLLHHPAKRRECRPADRAADRIDCGHRRRGWDRHARSRPHRWGRCGFSVSARNLSTVYSPVSRIVKAPVPDQQLYLGEDMLGPGQLGTLVLRAIVAQTDEAVGPPGLKTGAPGIGIGGILRSGKENFVRRRRLGQVHHSGRRNQRMAGLPLVGEGQARRENQQHSDYSDRKWRDKKE